MNEVVHEITEAGISYNNIALPRQTNSGSFQIWTKELCLNNKLYIASFKEIVLLISFKNNYRNRKEL